MCSAEVVEEGSVPSDAEVQDQLGTRAHHGRGNTVFVPVLDPCLAPIVLNAGLAHARHQNAFRSRECRNLVLVYEYE